MDAALIAAAASGKDETSEAEAAFLRVQEEMKQFRKHLGGPGNHRNFLPDPSTALATASMIDSQSRTVLSKMKLKFPASVSYLSYLNDSIAHNTAPGTTQGTHSESKLRDSQIAAQA